MELGAMLMTSMFGLLRHAKMAILLAWGILLEIQHHNASRTPRSVGYVVAQTYVALAKSIT
jgi:hypothetical protein